MTYSNQLIQIIEKSNLKVRILNAISPELEQWLTKESGNGYETVFPAHAEKTSTALFLRRP
ncbi:MAG: hypothetical protein QM610_08555 [Chitinophagaceae bacterium]